MLDISDNGIANAGIKTLESALNPKECALISLNLTNNELVGKEPMGILSRYLSSNQTLLELNLSCNKLHDIEDLQTAFYSQKCKLQKLDLSFNNLSSEQAFKLFSCLKQNKELKSLNLSGNAFTSAKFEHIAMFLFDNKTLEHLFLNECEINDKGAFAIFEGLVKNTKLQTLALSKNRIHADGVKKLSEGTLGKNSQLKHLDLSKNDISDDGVSYVI